MPRITGTQETCEECPTLTRTCQGPRVAGHHRTFALVLIERTYYMGSHPFWSLQWSQTYTLEHATHRSPSAKMPSLVRRIARIIRSLQGGHTSASRSPHGVFRRIVHLLRTWRWHKVSLSISLILTASSLLIYLFAFVHENPPAVLQFIQRLELSALDTRFRYRGQSHSQVDPRIVIVDIDQHSQEILGRWPFSRTHFAHLLDVLHDDGAQAVAFDITFSKPDEVSAPIRDIHEELNALQRQGARMDPRFAAKLTQLEAKYNSDEQFARAIERFASIVLGNYFLYSNSDLAGLDDATLDHYADLLSFFPFPRVQPLSPQTHRQDFARLVEYYANSGLLPKGAQANLEIFNDALRGDRGTTGFFNVPPDTDGVVRHSLLALPYGRSRNTDDWDLYASLDVQAARLFLRIPDQDIVLKFGPVGVARVEFGQAFQLRPDPLARAMINYRGPVRTYPYYSMADVTRRTFPKDAFRGKIVLVGASATGIGDLRTTPYGGLNFPGVEVHANVIDNILHQDFLQRGPKQVACDLVLILLFGIPVGIWLALTRPQHMWFGLSLAAPFVGGVYAAFLKGWWLNLTLPLLTLAANVGLVALYRVVLEEREKRKVRGSFQQYLSPEVIRRLLEHPQLVQPRKTEVTIMFSDIRNFTAISEQLDAQDLAVLLNQYLYDMTRIVFDTQGTLDKYIGDAVMAFWGAPFEESDHPIRACRAALTMMQRVGELREQWRASGRPLLDIGIGVNTGTASVGNMGSQLRYGYTAMGDAVNLSSRLEGLNKEYRTHIVVGPATYEAARDAGFLFRELDLIQVKGKLRPVTIYELVALKDHAADHQERLNQFARGRASYLCRDWLQAQAIFQSVLDRWPDDGPARTYWKRCQDYLFEAPSESWDGVFVMTHK
jgi:adenylate cyclase